MAELVGKKLAHFAVWAAGARAAYQEVLRPWGNAKPRSITADQARARLVRLGK